MELDLQWLLIGLPLAFALGWAASRLDQRQFRRDSREAPRAYFKGLNLLLNEQQDEAIDAFIEAVQHDPETAELHFALGNLFRRRGEVERAVRVHEHLLQRSDLKATDRHRAQRALARDYQAAGLFDRAEDAWRALLGSPFEDEAQAALLALHERARDWPAALQLAQGMQARTAQAGQDASNLATRMAHYHCELAEDAARSGRHDAAQAELQHAMAAAPESPRPLVLAGTFALTRGEHSAALAFWDGLRGKHPAAFLLVAREYARGAGASGKVEAAREALLEQADRFPGLALLQALAELDQACGVPSRVTLERWTHQLRERPTLAAAAVVLEQPRDDWPGGTLDALHQAVSGAAAPLQRYRCAACGFEAQHYFWQCPGCLSWDSYPAQTIDEQ